MAKFIIACLITLLAGCSMMGRMTSGASSGGMSAASGSAVFPSDLKKLGSGGTVIDPRTGDLAIYHGG